MQHLFDHVSHILRGIGMSVEQLEKSPAVLVLSLRSPEKARDRKRHPSDLYDFFGGDRKFKSISILGSSMVFSRRWMKYSCYLSGRRSGVTDTLTMRPEL